MLKNQYPVLHNYGSNHSYFIILYMQVLTTPMTAPSHEINTKEHIPTG